MLLGVLLMASIYHRRWPQKQRRYRAQKPGLLIQNRENPAELQGDNAESKELPDDGGIVEMYSSPTGAVNELETLFVNELPASRELAELPGC